MTTECRIFRNAALSVDFCVAYLLEWQCEGLKCRISNKNRLPRFFCILSVTFCGVKSYIHTQKRRNAENPVKSRRDKI